jgi:hypothetical protein
MMRPLYLDSGLDWQVRLDDGPSLHVSASGRARSLFRISRLSRVISPARARWDTDALLACLRVGVPVLFIDAKGETVGWCFGSRKRESTLANLLRIAVDEPDGGTWIRDWERAAARREVMATFRAIGLCGLHSSEHLEAAGARSRLCNWHRRRLGWAVGPWLHCLERYSEALAAEQLQEHVGDSGLIAHASPGIHLGLILSGLLQWRLHRIIDCSPAAGMLAVDPGRWAATAIEQHGTPLRLAAGALIGSLESVLRERMG